MYLVNIKLEASPLWTYVKLVLLVIKSLTIRIYLGLDDIYIEDFADIGGPDFTFIPWPHANTF